jgi:outer membrane protein assembly factor BamB
VTGDGQTGPGRTDDPMSADRRVLAIAAASMVALVLLGVVSAQLFTRSACTRIDPDPVPARATVPSALADEGVPEVGAVLTEAMPDLSGAGRDALLGAVAVLEDELGPLLGAADVRGADRLAIVDGEVAALGAVTTVLADDGTAVRATADVDEGTVVGSGTTLYSLALVNQLTGQVDAVQPLDADLAAGTCVDTATVGTPLAFHLDAGDGELLLLRVEEDGAWPAVEIHDAEVSSSTTLEVGTAPAGILAERVTGRLGQDVVVVGWRTGPAQDDDTVAALDRASLELRWTAPAAPLADIAQAGDRPLWVEVVAVGDDEVVLSLEPEDDPEADRSRATVVGLDLADGEVRWSVERELPPPALALPTDGGWAVASVDDDRLVVTEVDADSGELRGQSTVDGGDAARGAALEDGTVLITAGGPLVVIDADTPAGVADGRHVHAIDTDAGFVDVVAGRDRVHLLVTTGEGAVVLTFGLPTQGG